MAQHQKKSKGLCVFDVLLHLLVRRQNTSQEVLFEGLLATLEGYYHCNDKLVCLDAWHINSTLVMLNARRYFTWLASIGLA